MQGEESKAFHMILDFFSKMKHKPEQVVEMRSPTAKRSQAVQIISYFLVFNEELYCEECSEIVVGHF